MEERKKIVRITTWIAAITALAVTLILPLGYFAISYQYMAGSLDAEAEMTSHLVTDLINANPELWQYEQVRMEELLARRVRDVHTETRRILDRQNRLVAESASSLRAPLLTRRYDLMDSGVAVGTIEISRSLFPLLVRSTLMGLLALFCGQGIFVTLRVLPLRAVALAERSLLAANESLQGEIIERKHAEEKIVRHSAELQKTNAELKMLYQISVATSRSIELDQLLSDILHSLVETGLFPFEIKGTIFLFEGESLRLASSASLFETDVEPCHTIPLGECLCGLAVATGEVVVSRNSQEDERHCRHPSGYCDHGHVVIPLKAVDRICGVLNLFFLSPVEVDEPVRKLLETIGNQVGIAINNARLYEETKSFSLQDPLTGLANRRSLDINLEKRFDAARRYNENLSLVMLDIDHFKQYNDSHGHVAGDNLLVKIADVLQREIRDADLLFRYGGEEFLAILPHSDMTMACQAAERLRMAVEAEVGITISLGVASCREATEDKECLIRLADDALYRAKEMGRNRVESALGQPEPVRAERGNAGTTTGG